MKDITAADLDKSSEQRKPPTNGVNFLSNLTNHQCTTANEFALCPLQKTGSYARLEKKYDRTVTGLAVCLGIAVLFGVFLAIIVAWDCVVKTAAKKKKQMEMQKAKLAAKRAGYSGYEESEKVQLDPNDSISNPDYDGPKAQGLRSPAAVNAYGSLTPNNAPPNTHVNRAYMVDDETDMRYNQDYGAAAAPEPGPGATRYPGYDSRGGALPRVPDMAAEIEVHTIDDDHLRARMEQDRSTPEGSVGSAKNNEPPGGAANTSKLSRYDLRSPRYNDYNSSHSAANKYPALGFDAVNSQANHYSDYDVRTKTPGAWSTQSAALPPSGTNDGFYPADNDGRNAYSEKPSRDHYGRSGHMEPRQLDFTYGKTGIEEYQNKFEPSGAYIDKTDTVV